MKRTRHFSNVNGTSNFGARFGTDFRSTSKNLSARAVRQTALLLAISAPVIFAAIAVALGKEAGWDLLNYHWYDPFALLNGRLGFDIAVAHHATYYNPLADVPFHLIATHAASWAAGAYLGALFGVMVVLIGAIAYHMIQLRNVRLRLTVSVLLALAGALGGGAFPAIGNTSNDIPTAIGIFGALLLLVKLQPQLSAPELTRSTAKILLFAGFLAGASIGLKLTTLMYALGLCAATCVSAPTWRKRGASVALFGIGILAGFALLGGYWTLRLWQYGANPMFPYFNQIFHSPLLIDGSYRDPSFHPADSLAGWLFPFHFTANSRLVAEWDFRDAHIATAYVLIPLTLLLMLTGYAKTKASVTARTAGFLFVFAGVSYVVWLLLFSVYRYLIPLEMLSPVLISAAILLWPLPLRRQLLVIALVLAALQGIVRADIERLPWDNTYVSVEVPKISDPQHSMVLMSGVAPMAYVIPAFPRQIPFLRVDGWLVSGQDQSSGLAREMRARVEAHAGPLYMLFSEYDDERATAVAANYRLQLDRQSCQPVRSNVAEPLRLCVLTRS